MLMLTLVTAQDQWAPSFTTTQLLLSLQSLLDVGWFRGLLEVVMMRLELGEKISAAFGSWEAFDLPETGSMVSSAW